MTQHPNDIIRITPIFGYSGRPDRFVNVWTVRLISEDDVLDAQMISYIGAWLETIYQEVLDVQSTAYQYIEWDWANLTQDLVYPAEPWPTYTAGIVVGDPLPHNICAYAFARTAYAKVYGKKFVNGMAESHNGSDGYADSTVVAAMAAMVADGWGEVLLSGSRAFEGVIKTTLHGYVEPLVAVTTTQWRALRRRLIGVGG